MGKKLYISEGNRKMGYTPENDHDPRYYDAGDVIGFKELCYITDKYGVGSYCIPIPSESVLYTENYDVMKFLQNDCEIEPMWFDVCGDDVSTVDELKADGWTW